MKTKQFFNYYDDHHKNPVNQLLHFLSVSILIIFGTLALLFHAWWLIPLAVMQGYLIPHYGHKYYEKNNSMRIAYPMGCIVGNARMFCKTLCKLLSGKF